MRQRNKAGHNSKLIGHKPEVQVASGKDMGRNWDGAGKELERDRIVRSRSMTDYNNRGTRFQL